MNRRHIWQKQIVPMLDWIKYKCGPLLQSAAPWHDVAHALPLTYEELAAHSEGLDFTTDGEASVRGILYDRRQDMQSEFGLYFDDFPGGLRFTLLPKLGMLWRYEEEQRKTQNALNKTAAMTVEAISASGKQVERALFEAMDRQYKAVVDGATRLRQMTQVLFARPQSPKALPAPKVRRRKKP